MRIRSRFCFLLSNLLVFSFPLAVKKEESSVTLPKTDEAFSVLDEGDPSKDLSTTISMSQNSDGRNSFDQPLLPDKVQFLSTLNQPPSKDSTGLPGLIPSSGSALLAQSITDEIPGLSAAGAAFGAGLAGTLDLLWGRIQDVNLQLNDNPTNVKVVNPFLQLKKDDGTKPGGAVKGGTLTNHGGTGADTAVGGTNLGGSCPHDKFGSRTLSWCDLGYPSSVEIRDGYEIAVHGYLCTLFLLGWSQSFSPSLSPSTSLYIC